MAELVGVAQLTVGINAVVCGDHHVMDVVVQVGVEVHLDAGGVEEAYEAHVIVVELGVVVRAALHAVVDVVVAAQEVFLRDVYHGVVGEAPASLAEVTFGVALAYELWRH